MHDANPLQRDDSISQRLTHPTNLAIAAFGQNDTKVLWSDSAQTAWSRALIEDHHTRCHPIQEALIKWTVDPHDVFLFVRELGAKNLIDDIPIVRQ